MKRLFTSLLFALVACTGTTESGVPILLVVGYQENVADGAEGQVGLIEDTFDVAGTAREISFVEGSSRPLPARPIAYDLTDRDNSRDTLVVLSRNDGAANVNDSAAFLNFFNLTGVDADNPAAFEQTDPGQLELSADALDTTEPDLPLDLNFCPVDVQVSEGGRYAALLHDGEPCGIRGFGALDIIDLEPVGSNEPAKLLGRFSSQIVPVSFYLRQERVGVGDNRLYFFQNDPVGVQVTELLLPDENDNNPEIDPILGGDNLTEVADVADDTQEVEDLGLVLDGADENATAPVLVTLFDESFVPLRNYDTDAAVIIGNRVDTIEDSRKVLTDDFLTTDSVFILSDDEFTVHENVGEAAEEAASIVAADAVYEPRNNFVYFVSDETVSLFDPQDFQFEEDDEVDTRPFDVDELSDPVFVTWIQAVSDVPAPQVSGPE